MTLYGVLMSLGGLILAGIIVKGFGVATASNQSSNRTIGRSIMLAVDLRLEANTYPLSSA